MDKKRCSHFQKRELNIVHTAEQLLLEHGDTALTLDMIANELDIAKGTLYKHFKSKDELYMMMLLQNERHFYTLLKQKQHQSFEECLKYFVRYHLDHAIRTITFHYLEEKLANTATHLQSYFAELYQVRRQSLKMLIPMIEQHLYSMKSSMSVRDYLSALWALTYGAAMLLNSSFYQRYLGSRETLKDFYVEQAIALTLREKTQSDGKMH